MKPIIRVDHLSKQYRIGASRPQYQTLRDTLAQSLRRRVATEENTLWALRDVSFEVAPGEVIGVIGRNGAGKSTLLKLLSRITEPTSGEIDLYGRVGSLLEVGTGFHPELTGRENIFLNGAILGMQRTEIARQFDAIVAFAELARFIDTPVKHYSSGMYMRLAFAVAAHLEPEILIVDEVLAVGDAAFQKKCLGKMGEVARAGKTVLFVSHNTHALASLCQRVVWLEGGRVKAIGGARQEIARYEAATLATLPDGSAFQASDDAPATIRSVRLLDARGEESESFDLAEAFTIELTVAQQELREPIRLVLRLRALPEENVVLYSSDWHNGEPIGVTAAGEYRVRCEVPGNLLNSGQYSVSVGLDVPRGPVYCLLNHVKRFSVTNEASFGDGIYGAPEGTLSPYRDWHLVTEERAAVSPAPLAESEARRGV